MAYLKHFRTVRYRVPDPLHPGHSAFDERLDWSHTESVKHEGTIYEADSDGWIDFPADVAAYFAKYPGWRSPEQVDEEAVAGRLKTDSGDALPRAPRRKRVPA